MSKAKPKQDSPKKPIRPAVRDEAASHTGHSPTKPDSTPGFLAFLLKPNKTAFWILCGFYFLWLVFLAYVAYVNVRSGNQ
ncbi:MAG: hypothetical protein VXZ82_05360 [Planctomycetota bacterium]|nr:hypothetical protein [Planctomycetota bacterium]